MSLSEGHGWEGEIELEQVRISANNL
jgi:hypothetical protein